MANPNPSPRTRFQPGQSGNPAGRPKEKTLKEFAREYLASLSDDEKNRFLRKLKPEFVWRMAEGNPPQALDHAVPQSPIPIIHIVKPEKTKRSESI